MHERGYPVGDIDYAAEEKTYQEGIKRHFRWNFAVIAMDGALFWLGISFAAPSTILPLYVRHLTDSRLLIGLIATIAGAGWYLPQLFTASYVERSPRKKPIVVNIGFFSERLAFLVMAASAFLFAAGSPGVALVLLFATLTWHNVGAGIIAVAWQEMVAKVIPVHYRGRLLGIANFGGTATGVVGATLAAYILDRYPFPTNYALCFALAFVFILFSWISLALTREPTLHSRKPTVSMGEYWRRLPIVLREDPNFATYLLVRVITVLGRMGIGFLTVYAAERWRLTDSQAGFYTTVILVGQASANLFFGPLADRRGHKLVLEMSLGLSAFSMLAAVVAPSATWMYAVFAAAGALTAADIVSMLGIVMEFTEPDDRPTYMGLASTIPGLFAAIAPVIGGWIASRSTYRMTFLVAAILTLAAWAVLHWKVRDPRKTASQEPA
jgi:MFS family permease